MTIQKITTVIGVQLTTNEMITLIDACRCESSDCERDHYDDIPNYELVEQVEDDTRFSGLGLYSITHDVAEDMIVIGLVVCSYPWDDMKSLITRLDDNFENLRKTVNEKLTNLYGPSNYGPIGLYTIQDDCGCCS